jgi:hypothetical protein
MHVWTNGIVHLQVLSYTGELRRFEGKTLTHSVTHPSLRGADAPLVVDEARGRIYAGRPLVELDLSTLATVAEHSLDTAALALQPDGRLVTLEPGPMGPLLMTGEPSAALQGRWEDSVPLSVSQMVTVPQSAAEGPPRPNQLGMAVRLRASDHGLTVADGRAGVVLLLAPNSSEVVRAWAYNASDDAELEATAFAHGVVCTPRAGLRDSHVHLLVKAGGFAPLIQWGGGCFARAVGDEHVFCIDERSVVVFSVRNLAEPVTHRDVGGRTEAVAAGGGRFVIGFEEGIHIARLIGEGGLAVHTVTVEERMDLIAQFGAEPSKDIEDQLVRMGRGGLSTRFLPDGTIELAVSSVDPSKADELRQTVLDLGAHEVTLKKASL